MSASERPMFEVDAESSRQLMRIVMRGFWSNETIADYDTALTEAAARLVAAGCPISDIRVFVDAREMDTQSQPLVAEYERRFGDPGRQPRRIATVMSKALPKLQAQRVAFENQRIFSDADEAMTWLMS